MTHKREVSAPRFWCLPRFNSRQRARTHKMCRVLDDASWTCEMKEWSDGRRGSKSLLQRIYLHWNKQPIASLLSFITIKQLSSTRRVLNDNISIQTGSSSGSVVPPRLGGVHHLFPDFCAPPTDTPTVWINHFFLCVLRSESWSWDGSDGFILKINQIFWVCFPSSLIDSGRSLQEQRVVSGTHGCERAHTLVLFSNTSLLFMLRRANFSIRYKKKGGVSCGGAQTGGLSPS